MNYKVPASVDDLDVAIIGMAGRFPGARNLQEFWRNLAGGVESITRFSLEELKAAGVDPALLADPAFVPASAILEDAELFDAAFFGYSPREARLMDPQSRAFLECAWEAFESAGYNPRAYMGPVGVYATQSLNTYLLGHAIQTFNARDFTLSAANFPTVIGNGNDFLTTRVSYKLHLNGPSVNVQAACSSSLVAVHFARQAVISGECDMALAGGVSIYVPQKTGYLLTDGMILSPDGHCRPFDADAKGTVFGRGAGVVLLKPLNKAIADGDAIRAVIKGSAINNDGVNRAGYTAPGVDGQARVVAEALANAGVDADTIGYIEAHGTGTTQGDPIEVAALTQGFRATTARRSFCALGSVKSNIGHLDVAAGMAGLIKTVLMLEQKQLVPTLHFKKPNPLLNIDESPFYVNTALSNWKDDDGPRRGGVSAFGMGGTNAHVVLEEAPSAQPSTTDVDRPVYVLPLSARTPAALSELSQRYVDYIDRHPHVSIADLCFTAGTGRVHFEHRAAFEASSLADLRARLTAPAENELPQREEPRTSAPRVAFLFTGQGAQYAGMARRLYETEPVFRKALDECDAAVRGRLPAALLTVVFPGAGDADRLHETEFTQPALFAVEYALTALWRSWGVEPAAVLGHSVGEYVAACVAGVFSLEDALTLVAARARLMQRLPQNGGMAAVMADESTVAAAIAPHGASLAIAAVNAPDSIVISGERTALDAVLASLEGNGIRAQRLRVSHAFHSSLLDPMLDAFEEVAAGIKFSAPRIDLISNLTGAKVDPEKITTTGYWRRHAREAVLFAKGVRTLAELGYRTFLEVGPDPVLIGLAQRSLDDGNARWLPSLRRTRDDRAQIASAVARLYELGANIDWATFDRRDLRRRVELPTYPFQRERFWLDPAVPTAARTGSDREVHPLLGRRIRSALASLQFEVHLAEAAALDDIVLAAGSQCFPGRQTKIEELIIEAPLAVPRIVQVIVTPSSEGRANCQIWSTAVSDDADSEWQHHATATVSALGRLELSAGRADVLDWTYSLAWKEAGSSAGHQAHSEISKRRWVIFADAGGMGEALAQRLTAAGGEALLVARSSGEPFQRTDNVVRMDPHREDHFERLAPLLNASGVDPAIVHLWSLDAGEGTGLQTDAAEIMRGVERSCGSALRIVQRLERRDARLWFITRGVHSVNASGGPTSISQAPLGGWVASLRCERPELCPVLVDLDTGNGDPVADLWSALSDEVEDRVAFRDGRRYVQRLEPGPGPAPNAASHAAAVRSDAAYLITGGLGALGLATARWLASRGAGHIVLTSRSAPSESASQAIRDLESRGVSVRVVLGDVARIDDVRRIMETIGGMPALAGVVHAAGTLDDGVIERQSWARYEKVMAPKVQGAWNLHLATSAAPLDFFIQFSSVASVFGSEGQTSYAAANAFLDGLADLRRAAGLPAVSINWGPWSGSGMAASMSERDRQRLARIGFDPIVEERASAVLDLALEQATAQIVAAHVRWPDYLERFDGQVPPLYEKVGSSAPASTLKPARASAVKGDLQLEIERLPMKRRRQAVFERIGSEAVRVLGLSAPSALDPRRPLHELGLDSLMAIELRNTLGRAIDRKLPATLLFKAPSIEALTDAVMEELGAADAELTPAAASETSEIDRLSDEEVADGLAAELEALARKGWAD